MLFTLEFIYGIFPDYRGIRPSKAGVSKIMTDSREDIPEALFIPIVGEKFDAHHFINQAKENGAIAVLWDKNHTIPEGLMESMTFFLVQDTTEALQILAHNYIKKIQPIVIGITGSNGKTTTKDLLLAVLQQKYVTHATKGNFNNEIGLPLTILDMNSETEVVILEMGMSDFGEIDRLSKIAEPDYAIITNIGESHIEQLESRSGIAKAKLEIVNGMKHKSCLIIDGDESLLTSFQHSKPIITCGFNVSNDIIISDVERSEDSTRFKWNGTEEYTVPLLGEHHALNASFVIMLAEKLDITQKMIQTGLHSLEHTSMRFEKNLGKNGVTLINDAYNASATSMKAAIHLLKEFKEYEEKIVVLGDILELGSLSIYFHKQVADTIEPPIDVVYTYGSISKVIPPIVKEKHPSIEVKHFSDQEELVASLLAKTNKSTVILFKASRGMALEKVVEPLSL